MADHEHRTEGCEVRECIHCDTLKWSCDFYPSKPSKCKACCVLQARDWQREKVATDGDWAEARADYQRLRKYGLTRDDFDRLLKEQDGKCAICKTFEPGPRALSVLHVDHDHASGKVRGLLCRPCNTLIGKAKEDPLILMTAASYLIRHQQDGGQ